MSARGTSYKVKDRPPKERPLTKAELILAVCKDAGIEAELTTGEIEKRSGVKHTPVYLTHLVRAGQLVRVGRGTYALPAERHKEIVLDATPDEDIIAEEIRLQERRRIGAALGKALEAAIPAEPLAYIQGFRDGANFIAERVLGLTVDPDDTAAQ